MYDKRAVRVLFSAYWGSGGWKDEHRLDPAEFAYARSRGVMFDPVMLSHADVVKRAIAARDQVGRTDVANAFVASLGTRDLGPRSALGSYAVLQHFPDHAWSGNPAHCDICGAPNREARQENLNVLSFERLKWGGIRHLQPVYAAFDLEQFGRLDHAVPSREDVGLLRDVFEAIAAVPPQATAARLHAALPSALKSNKAEREVLIGILGLCGILETREHSGFRTSFVPWLERDLPGRRFVDMPYPACWWTGADGVNREAVSYWFGHLLSPARS